MVDENILKLLIQEKKIDEAVAYINSSETRNEAIDLLLVKIADTGDPWERHTIAMVLSDLKCGRAVDVLIPLINKYCGTDNYSGLVFALMNLDCADRLAEIAHLMYDGNYMVRRYMFDLLSGNWQRISSEDKKKIAESLAGYKAALDKETETLSDKRDGIVLLMDELC